MVDRDIGWKKIASEMEEWFYMAKMSDDAKSKTSKSGLHEGLKTHSPSVDDSSRRPIGSVHTTSVDAEDRPGGVGEVTPSTIGPRTA